MPYALVTGASKGIGLAIAQELASRKFDLLLVARSESLLQQVARQLADQYGVKTDFLALDLAAADAPQRVFDWCQSRGYTLTMLVNNAGYGLSGPFESHSLAEHTDMMALNMTTLVALTYRFLPQLQQQPRAYILNIGSSAAYQAIPRLAVYAASKAFVLRFSRGLHQELQPTNVTVTCVCPGATDTDFVNRAKVTDKARKAADKVNMTPADVARQAVEATLAGRVEVVTGVINKLGKFLSWLLPGSLVEQTSGNLYK